MYRIPPSENVKVKRWYDTCYYACTNCV